MANRETTLDGLARLITNLATHMERGFAALDARMEKGFAAVADDIADARKDMATREQLFALHTQVTSIETQLRAMHSSKLETRVAELEEEVFGKARG